MDSCMTAASLVIGEWVNDQQRRTAMLAVEA